MSRLHFTIPCYKLVSYSDPEHPRHGFSEDWDSAAHPRFAFGRIQRAFEQLTDKGYTVRLDSGMIKILNSLGETVFQMEMS